MGTITEKEWSFFNYMAGDNNLSEEGVKDMDEMAVAGSSGATNIIIEFDSSGGDFNGTIRFLKWILGQAKLIVI